MGPVGTRAGGQTRGATELSLSHLTPKLASDTRHVEGELHNEVRCSRGVVYTREDSEIGSMTAG